MPFAENLRRIRLAAFLSQAELGRRSGVHAITITRLEAGRTAPSTRTVRALAETLGVRPTSASDRAARRPSKEFGRKAHCRKRIAAAPLAHGQKLADLVQDLVRDGEAARRARTT